MTVSRFDQILANASARIENAGELTFSQLEQILEELGISEAQLDGTLDFLEAIPGIVVDDDSPETLYRWDVRASTRAELSSDPGRTWDPTNPCFYCGSQIAAGICENSACPDPLRFAAEEFVAPAEPILESRECERCSGFALSRFCASCEKVIGEAMAGAPKVEAVGVEFREGVRLESIHSGRGDEVERLWKNAQTAVHLVDNPKIVEAAAAVRLLEVAAASPEILNRIPRARASAETEAFDPLELFLLVRRWIESSPEPARRIRALTYFGEAGLLLLARPAVGEDAPSRVYLETVPCHCGGRVFRFELKTGHSREICEDC